MSATSMKELLQQINGEKTSVVQGIVTSASPLKVALVNDTTINIPSDLLIVPEHLTKRTKQVKIIEVNGETESGGPTQTKATTDDTGLAVSTDGSTTVKTASGGTSSTNASGVGTVGSGGYSSDGGTDYTAYDYSNFAVTDSADSHQHTIPKHRHIMNHTHAIGDHSHTIDSHDHSIRNHKHSLGNHKHDIDQHKHDIKLSNKTVQIEIDDSLMIGEYVHMLSVGQGKIYYILGRVNAKPITT